MSNNIQDFLRVFQEVISTARNDEERDALLKKLAKEIPPDVVDDAIRLGLAQRAREFNVGGYTAWYELKYGFKPPKHVVREIEQIFSDHEAGRGSVIFASRGSWKTVSISVTLIEWMIGNRPTLTHLVVGANDDSAEKVTKAIAATIEHHPAWKMAFPNVVPDTGKWSTEGFTVIDTGVERDEWAKMTGGRVDPTFVGGGYKSTRLNGKHPTGVLCMDDMHDINNSMSQKERNAVVMALTTIILKTAVREADKLVTWIVDVGTPWAKDDAHHVMKDSGSYGFLAIPAMTRAEEDEEGAVFIDGVNQATGAVYEDIVGWWILTWPERFGVNSIMQERSLGKSQFWQMIMLDLHTGSKGGIRYYTYLHADIDNNLPALGGVDPTTFDTNSATRSEERSHFALAYGLKLPRGGAVISGGVLEQCTLLQAENHILAAQAIHPNWQATYVEDVAVGKVAMQAWRRNPRVRVLPSGLKGISDARVTNKKARVESISRWFEDGTIRISDADTPFLNALRNLLDNFEDMDSKSHDPGWDAADAVFHVLRNMTDVLNKPSWNDDDFMAGRKVKQPHPLAGLSSYRGY